jgi:hypothetical protein
MLAQNLGRKRIAEEGVIARAKPESFPDRIEPAANHGASAPVVRQVSLPGFSPSIPIMLLKKTSKPRKLPE